jgi:hypothetical protein
MGKSSRERSGGLVRCRLPPAPTAKPTPLLGAAFRSKQPRYCGYPQFHRAANQPMIRCRAADLG